MKKVTLILTFITMTMSSFTIPSSPKETGSKAAGQLALNITSALQHGSSSEYAALFPTLAEFQEIMKQNSILYGPFATEAREDFALDYEHNLFHQVKDSFDELLNEGRKKGIDWKHVRLVRVDVEETDLRLHASPFTLVLTTGEKEFSVRIEKTLFIKGQWKVSQFIRFV